jgi:hypothetical protein
MQFRGGSCSGLSNVLTSDEVLSTASFVTTELINYGVSYIRQYCNSQNFHLYFIPRHTFCLLCHSTLLVHPLMQCNWLLFCVMYHHTHHCQTGKSETSLSEPELSINSKISSLFSLSFQIQSHIFCSVCGTCNSLMQTAAELTAASEMVAHSLTT